MNEYSLAKVQLIIRKNKDEHPCFFGWVTISVICRPSNTIFQHEI